MKTLLLTQCHLVREEQARLMSVASALWQRLNPGYDLLMIDNASPLNPVDFGIPSGLIFRFPDAIGHFSGKFAHERENPKDGPGRAIMTGLQMALDLGYQRVVHVDSDCLFARPFDEGFAQMKKPTACLPRIKWGYLEWNAWWIADLPWLVNDHRFIEKYDWPNQTGKPEGERVYEALLTNYLQIIPWRGARGDSERKGDGSWHQGWITADNLRAVYPDGCDFLTHVDQACFAEFLKMNGHEDLAGAL